MAKRENTTETGTQERVREKTRVLWVTLITLGSAAILAATAIFFIPADEPGGGGETLCDVQVTTLPATLGVAGAKYCLANNITGANSDFKFTADNVSLNGRGFTVSGTSKIALTGRKNVIIKDLTIPGGVSIVNGDHNQILNTKNTGIYLETTNDNIIKSNVVTIPQNGFAALQMIGLDTKYIEGNTIAQNTFTQTVTGTPNPTEMRFIRWFFARNNMFNNNTLDITGTGNIMQIHYSYFNTFKNNSYSITYPNYQNATERYGWYIRDGSSYNAFLNNYVSSNQYAARFNGPGNVTVPFGHDNIIKGNSFYGGLPGGPAGATPSTVMHDTTTGNDIFDHNLFYAQNVSTAAIQLGAGPSTAQTNFTNNTVYAENSIALRIEGTGKVFARNNLYYSVTGPAMHIEGYSSTKYDGNYNSYWRAGSTTPIRYQQSCCGTRTVSLASFISQTGKDLQSISLDPAFDPASGQNYNLSSTSPNIDVGDQTIPPPPFGGSRIDIGRFEYRQPTAPDMTAPTITVVYPELNTRSTPAGRYISSTGLISGIARDNGDLKEVKVQIDGKWYTALGTYSWGLSLRNVALANTPTHTLVVQAVDTAGRTTTSPSLTFSIDNTLPTGSITIPPGTVLSGNAVMTATASDNIGIASVQFHISANQSGFVDFDAPYTATADTRIYSNGNYQVSATIQDTAGNFYLTPSVTVTITN